MTLCHVLMNAMAWSKIILTYGADVISAIIFGLGCFLYIRKRIDSKYIPIIFLALSSLFCDLLSYFLVYQIKNSMPAIHLYGVLHGSCLVWFFYLNLNKSKSVLLIGGLYLGCYVLNSIFFESIWTYNVMAKVTQNILFLIMSFWFFYHIYRQESIDELEKNGIFWIVVGILFYHAGAFFSSLFALKILSGRDNLFGSWHIHNIANQIKNVLILIGIWMGRTRLQTK